MRKGIAGGIIASVIFYIAIEPLGGLIWMLAASLGGSLMEAISENLARRTMEAGYRDITIEMNTSLWTAGCFFLVWLWFEVRKSIQKLDSGLAKLRPILGLTFEEFAEEATKDDDEPTPREKFQQSKEQVAFLTKRQGRLKIAAAIVMVVLPAVVGLRMWSMAANTISHEMYVQYWVNYRIAEGCLSLEQKDRFATDFYHVSNVSEHSALKDQLRVLADGCGSGGEGPGED